QALLERHLGAPAELALREAHVEHAPLQLAEPCRGLDRLEGRPRDRPAELVKLDHRGLEASADVEDSAPMTGRGERGPRDVPGVGVIARLQPVAEDARRLPL